MSFSRALISLMLASLALTASLRAQTPTVAGSEYADDGTPVLIMNLPGPEEIRAKAVWAKSVAEIEREIGKQPILDLIDLVPGVEAATAVYPEGKLLLVEYPTPQFSVEEDVRFRERIDQLGPSSAIVYRRIGNYSAFVFEVSDAGAANRLLDQIKYAKTVQWLGEDPNYNKKVERYFAVTLADVFISTLIAIVVGAGIAIGIGVVSGLVFYKMEEKKRHARQALSDAGGMTRLNLDGISEE